MLNKLLIGISLLLIAVSIAFDVNYFNYSKPIAHSQNKDITLSDFKGLKKIGQNLDGGNEFAFIETEIKKIKTDSGYTVKALFHPSRSYVYKTNIIGGEKLLKHEVYHFHITEYIARKLRKELAEHKNNNINIDSLIKEFKLVENQMQMEYDKETYHSYYVGKQLFWQKKTDSLLNTLNEYK